MLKESDILYSKDGYWLILENGKTPGLGKPYKAYAIYQDGVTHATRRATIGESLGLLYAKARLDTFATTTKKEA